jgi:hypothetical protein
MLIPSLFCFLLFQNKTVTNDMHKIQNTHKTVFIFISFQNNFSNQKKKKHHLERSKLVLSSVGKSALHLWSFDNVLTLIGSF